ncbi:hypothetical protein [Marixanthomonas spongiae]|uniref:Uncharacterized protein n=1 Tax=Marixanthomonas spongiae TaxID=2174845 RepID=A0A2U0I0B2_9FLAO|nr:hypothetical protein [Marixanthomonas spongiae]PVW14542.1 hypothetical protein DDV96_08400 [Marixanthomonas spongiae]
MFTTGQWVFAILAAIAFIVIIIYSYRKDINRHKKHYKGTFWILLGFIVFILLLLAVKTYIKG